jgi:hypothetical protein
MSNNVHCVWSRLWSLQIWKRLAKPAFSSLMRLALVVLAAAAWLTVVQRVLHVRTQLLTRD